MDITNMKLKTYLYLSWRVSAVCQFGDDIEGANRVLYDIL